MAQYKVPQDIEAEDKLLGPLTFKQFIFAIIAAVSAAGVFFGWGISPLISIIFLPPMLAFSVLAFYRRPDQSVETYLMALFGFMFKPRKRIWNRDGIAEHVIITAPKAPEKRYDDTKTREQVKGQLKQLAKVIDTRGWSTKQVNDDDDRLVGLNEMAYSTPAANYAIEDSSVSDDIMDEHTDPVAFAFEQKSQATTGAARQHALQVMQQARDEIAQNPNTPQPPTR